MSPSELARFEALFERNYHDVARFCARRSATTEDAEDAATEVFGTAWRRIADVPPAPQDRLWLFGVARRTLANANRANVRRTRLALRLQANAPPPAPRPHAGGVTRAQANALAAHSAADRELQLQPGR